MKLMKHEIITKKITNKSTENKRNIVKIKFIFTKKHSITINVNFTLVLWTKLEILSINQSRERSNTQRNVCVHNNQKKGPKKVAEK